MITWRASGGEHVTGRAWAPGPVARSVWCLPDDAGPPVLVVLRDDDVHVEHGRYRWRLTHQGPPPAEWLEEARQAGLPDRWWRVALGGEAVDAQAPEHGASDMDPLF